MRLGRKPDPAPVERYAIFAGLGYYPAGGWLDFVTSTGSLTVAMSVARQTQTPEGAASWGLWTDMDWWQIVDTTTGTIITKKSDKGTPEEEFRHGAV